MPFLNCTCSHVKVDNLVDAEAYRYTEPAKTYELSEGAESTSPNSLNDPSKLTLDAFNNMVEFHPNPEHYEIFTVIGQGVNDSATICLAKHVPSAKYVAVRRINLEKCDIDFSLLQYELLMSQQLQHENVLSATCSFVYDNQLWTVFPLAAFGSCKDLLHAHFTEGLPELAIAYILRDVLLALEYIHHKGIIHRSVRASHILVAANGLVSVSGLRTCCSMLEKGRRVRAIHDFPQSYNNSLLWASPELLEQNLAGYDTKSDVYSVGITACELANGMAPFHDMLPTEMLLEKFSDTKPRLLDNLTIPELQQTDDSNTNTEAPQQADSGIGFSTTTTNTSIKRASLTAPYQRTFSPQFHQFVEQCVQGDPQVRPSVSALLHHSFFKQVRRKSSLDILPELLQPVAPLTDIKDLPKDDMAIDQLTEDLETVQVEDDSWCF